VLAWESEESRCALRRTRPCAATRWCLGIGGSGRQTWLEGWGQGEALGLRQHTREREACSGARVHGKARSVVLGRRCRVGTRQVFDKLSSTRARMRDADRKNTKGLAC
jgi:hypothetical protein